MKRPTEPGAIRGTIRVAPSWGGRLAGIEGLRALAASSIVVYHTWRYSSPNGTPERFGALSRFILPSLPVGVTLFFTLSGFLLYRPFAAATMRGGSLPDIARYSRNRALRILPAYWVILLMVALVLQVARVGDAGTVARYGSLAGDPGLLGRNIVLVQNYGPSTLLTGIGPTWSLAVEIAFYACLPLLALVAWRLGRRASSRKGRRLAALVPPVVLLVIGISGKVVAAFVVPGLGPGLGWTSDWHSVLERSFLVQGDLFAFGMAIAVLRIDAEDGLLRLPPWWPAVTAGMVAAIAVPTVWFGSTGRLHPYAYDTFMAFACGLVLSLVVISRRKGGRPSTAARMLEVRPLVAIGLISYSLFLWNEPLILWLRDHGLTSEGRRGLLLNLVVVWLVVGALSTITYRFVELPVLRRKRHLRVSEPAMPVEQAKVAP